jgi:MFS family permease
MLPAEQSASSGPNHPLALRMAVIAFLAQNLGIACVWGSFSVLLVAVEKRLGVGRDLSTLGAPAVNLAMALCAPLAGMLATRYSLRWIMIGGSVCSVAGFVLLASTANFPLYLVAFGLLLGPGLAVSVILPATLVTRWFSAHRGRALGIVTSPILLVAMPFFSVGLLQSYGLSAAYVGLAALSAVGVICNLFVIDRPPEDVHSGQAQAAEATLTMAQLALMPRFWALVLPFIASAAGSIILTAHMVPMLRSWGLSTTLAASLLSVLSLGGIAGTICFGWLADKVGGAAALTIVAFDSAVLFMLLLLHPSFVALAIVIGLIGAHGCGVVPVFSLALSQGFGRENFSRAFGLTSLINTPSVTLCVPLAALVFTRTGSYTGAIIGEAAFLAVACLVALSVWRPRAVVAV